MTRTKPKAGSQAPDTSRRAWSRQVEQASLAMNQQVMQSAIRNFRILDDPGLKLQIAQEIAETRGAELTFAYHNVVMVTAGFKCKRAKSGMEKTIRTPCVIFVVRRKWKPDSVAKEPHQALPRHLLTYASLQGRQLLVAVPTDVQPEAWYFGANPHAASGITVGFEGQREYGTLSCAVEIRLGSTRRRFGLSALHVLTPKPEVSVSKLASGTPVELVISDPQPPGVALVGASVAAGGRIVGNDGISFDVQLAQLSNWRVVKSMLGAAPLSRSEPFVDSLARLGELAAKNYFEIRVPSNHPDWIKKIRPRLQARFVGMLPRAFAIPYQVRQHGIYRQVQVRHWELIKLQPTGSQITVGGDSGSPVVIWFDDGSCSLVGIHIAGDSRFSYVIPAWQLFDIQNYFNSLPSDASVNPVNL